MTRYFTDIEQQLGINNVLNLGLFLVLKKETNKKTKITFPRLHRSRKIDKFAVTLQIPDMKVLKDITSHHDSLFTLNPADFLNKSNYK